MKFITTVILELVSDKIRELYVLSKLEFWDEAATNTFFYKKPPVQGDFFDELAEGFLREDLQKQA